jgi:hypothetical protein
MKSVQSQQCSRCQQWSYYYPEKNGQEVLVVGCHQCGHKNLIPGWEVSYTSEEDAKMNALFDQGRSSRQVITIPVKQPAPVVKIEEKPIVDEVWEVTMNLMWIDGVLNQQYRESVTGKVKWCRIPSGR